MGFWNLFGLKPSRVRHPLDRRQQHMNADYYQHLHTSSSNYQENNWLMSEVETVLSCKPGSLLEIGFGNGRFLVEAAARVERVIGVDWAVSPIAKDMPANVELIVADVTKHALPTVDLVCSADVLEHFAPDAVDSVLASIHRAARYNFHVIACYDDGHSHLSIFLPDVWLAKFRSISPDYRMVRAPEQRGKKRGTVCVIANY